MYGAQLSAPTCGVAHSPYAVPNSLLAQEKFWRTGMKFQKWVAQQVEKTGLSKTRVLKELSTKCGVSLITLQTAERGGVLRNYEKAQQVSKGTKGAVSAEELCK